MGAASSPFSERDARGTILRNETTMPVIVGEKARGVELRTRGPVQENKGREVVIHPL